MAKKLEIVFSWQRHPGGRPTARLRQLVAHALERLEINEAEVGVLICDDATIRSLNRHFRGKDKPTDVLSFPAGFEQPEGPHYLGDVAISLATAQRQARSAGHTVETELAFLLLHGILHLCGHDHDADSGEMRALEVRLRRELVR